MYITLKPAITITCTITDITTQGEFLAPRRMDSNGFQVLIASSPKKELPESSRQRSAAKNQPKGTWFRHRSRSVPLAFLRALVSVCGAPVTETLGAARQRIPRGARRSIPSRVDRSGLAGDSIDRVAANFRVTCDSTRR
jgi:hypothetical protein